MQGPQLWIVAVGLLQMATYTRLSLLILTLYEARSQYLARVHNPGTCRARRKMFERGKYLKDGSAAAAIAHNEHRYHL